MTQGYESHRGLFGSVKNATLEYFGVGKNSVINGGMRLAGVVGYANGGTLTGCWNEGQVNGNSTQTGGIVGYMDSTAGDIILRQCFNLGTVKVDVGGRAA